MIRDILRMGDPRLLRVSEPVRAFGYLSCVRWWPTCSTPCTRPTARNRRRPRSACRCALIFFGYADASARNPRYPDADPVPQTILVNPVIEPIGEDMEEGWEGCLSVPGLRGVVDRHRRLRYHGVDLQGRPIDRTVEGFHARVVQHECDHLDGILYPMRVRDFSRFGFAEVLFPELAGQADD